MGRIGSILLLLPLLLMLTACLSACRRPAPPPPMNATTHCPSVSAPASAPTSRPTLPAIHIDRASNTIAIQAYVALRQGPLELLLCRRLTKEYESILTTDARPSHIHAALLALGLDPGRPAYYDDTHAKAAIYVPPAGAELTIRLRYKDDSGNQHELDPSQWLLRQSDQISPASMNWVFVGSSPILQAPYWADQSGDIISLANYEASVIDVPFASTRDNANLLFAANMQAIPPVGTPVEVIIQPAAGARNAAVASAMIEIDSGDGYLLDGATVTLRDIQDWAKNFHRRHARPYIVIMARAPVAPAAIERIKRILRHEQFDDIDVLLPEGQAASPAGGNPAAPMNP